MRITLNENEIKEALVRYVAGQGVDISGRNVEVSMTAGRGANGYTADIDITDATYQAIENISEAQLATRNAAGCDTELNHKTASASLMNEIAGMDVTDETSAVDTAPAGGSLFAKA